MFQLVLFLSLTEPGEVDLFSEGRAVVVARFASEAECDRARWDWFENQKTRLPEELPPAPPDTFWRQVIPGACERVDLVG